MPTRSASRAPSTSSPALKLLSNLAFQKTPSISSFRSERSPIAFLAEVTNAWCLTLARSSNTSLVATKIL